MSKPRSHDAADDKRRRSAQNASVPDAFTLIELKVITPLTMSRPLTKITNWSERAHAAKYCVQTLADHCRVSVRTLERHIKLRFGKCPLDWLGDLQMQRAMELLPECSSVKEVALELGYAHAQNFSRDFKNHTGHAPSDFYAASRTRV